MKKSLIFDRTGKCKGCESEYPGPSKILDITTMCVWCERNPYLLTEIQDFFKKKVAVDLISPVLPGVEDDSNPIRKANEEYLKGWGLKEGGLDKKRKNTRGEKDVN